MKKKRKLRILESGEEAIPGRTYILTEAFIQNFEIVKDPFKMELDESTGELTERRVSNGRMTIRGIFQCENRKNGNGRTYPKGLWERHLSESSNLIKAMKDRRLTGRIEHPTKDQSVSIRDAAIRISHLEMAKPDPDGGRNVIGEAEILSTPDGAILRALVRDKVKFGISSRGRGQVDAKGVVDEKTFVPLTWDIVGNPSTPGAFPSVVDSTDDEDETNESEHGTPNGVLLSFVKVNGKTRLNLIDESTGQTVKEIDWASPNGDSRMSAKKMFESLRTATHAVLARELNEANLVEIDTALEESQVSLGEFVTENEAYTDVVSSLQSKIKARREEIEEAKKDGTAVDEGETEDDGEETEDTNESDSDDAEDTDESEDDDTVIEVPKAKYENLVGLLKKASKNLAENEATIEQQNAQLQEADTANEQMAARIEELEEETAALYESQASLTAIIQRTTASYPEVAESVEEAIDEAIELDESLETLRPTLEKCSTVEEVRNIVERTSVAPKRSRSDLPPLNESKDTKLNSKTDQKRTTGSPSTTVGSGAVQLAEKFAATFTNQQPVLNETAKA